MRINLHYFKTKYILMLCLFLFSLKNSYGQQAQPPVTGKVTSVEGEALAGVSVSIKGESTVTQTNSEGDYQINVSLGKTLVFHSIGYEEQEVEVTGTIVNVSLAETTSQLDEVVVVGYNTVRKVDLTGAVASIGTKEIEQMPVQNAIQAMQGRLAGVDVTSNSRPGQIGSIRIRGNRSLLATNEPLYVVDGMPLAAGGIDAINPHDIESIDVLKDASATAIYGSRGANGVVLVTTKGGKVGSARITYNFINSYERINELDEMFNAQEYAEYRRNSYRSVSTDNASLGYTTPYPNPVNDQRILGNDPFAWESIAQGYTWVDKENLIPQMRPTTAAEQALWGVSEVPMYDGSRIPTTNWADYVTQTGVTQDHSLNVTMGTEKIQGYFSGGYLNQEGTNKGQDYKRYNAKASVELKPNDWFTLGGSLTTAWSIQNYGYTGSGSRDATSIYGAARGMLPFAVPYDDNGEYIFQPGGDINIVNPILEHEYVINERTALRAFGSIFAQVKILEGLQYRVNFGPDFRNFRNGQFQDERSILRGGGVASSTNYARLGQEQNFAWTWDNLVYYDKVFAEKHALSVTLLHSMSSNRTENSDMTAIDLPYNSQKWYNLGSTSRGELQGWGSGYRKNTIMSYMARVNYIYNNKYMLTASTRWDGASVLAPGNQWHAFPAVSLGWKMEEEEFLRDVEWISQLKPRLGFGVTGNSAIGPYTTMGGLIQMPIVFGNETYMGFIPSDPKAANPGTMANKDLKWESTSQYNLGLDFAFFNNRIRGYLDIYKSHTNDLLMSRNIPSITGFTRINFNVGKTENRGFDFTLSSTNIAKSDFTWNTDLSLSTNRDKIVELYAGKNDAPELNFFIDEPLFVYYDLKKIGIWQTSDAEEMKKFNDKGATYKAGDIRVEDVNGDYIIDQINDRQILGNRYPKWTAGITNTFNYKDFELSFFIYSRWGFMMEGGAVDMQGRYSSRKVDYWRPDNPTNAYPKADNGNGGQPIHYSSMNYQDGSFVKVKNISLGYTFPTSITDNIRFSNLKVYAQVLNPYTYSKNGFIDPDIFSSTSSRSFIFGINASF